MSGKAVLEEQVKQQGELVRKLKAAKENKEKVSLHHFINGMSWPCDLCALHFTCMSVNVDFFLG